MTSASRPPANGRKKKIAVFSALRRAGAILLISLITLEKAVQFYVCPPECCSAEYGGGRPGTDKDQGKKSLDFIDPTEIGQGCIINDAEIDNCFNLQNNQDAHEIVKLERLGNEAEPDDADDSHQAFIRFIKKNNREVALEYARAMQEMKDIKEDDRTLHTECGDYKKVFLSGRWTYIAQT